jgi:hypothetical protein
MPLAPVQKLGITQETTRPFGLYIDGFDVLVKPGTGGGTPIESIVLVEEGPGRVSSLDFTFEDPTNQYGTPPAGADVQFWDRTSNYLLFKGTIRAYSISPFPAATGDVLTISCDGIEALLDWRVITVATVGIDSTPVTFGMSSDKLGKYLPEINTLMNPTPASPSSDTYPVGYCDVGGQEPNVTYTLTATAGSTLRGQFQAMINQANWSPGTLQGGADVSVTIDFYGRLRTWATALQLPTGYTNLTISDTIGGAIAAANLDYEVSPLDIIHEVFVQGTGASGMFSDGSGVRGQQAYLSAPDATTAAAVEQAGRGYLANQAASVRGSLDIEQFTPLSTVHAGCLVIITDATIGLTAQSYVIGSIRKTFQGNGLHNWTVSFGGPPESAMGELRRLTRAVVN